MVIGPYTGPSSSRGAPHPNRWTLRELWNEFSRANFQRKINLAFRMLFALIVATIVWLGRKLWNFVRGPGRTFGETAFVAVIVIGAIFVALFAFGKVFPSILAFLKILKLPVDYWTLSPLATIWILALLSIPVLLKKLPNQVRINRRVVSRRHAAWQLPLTVALFLTSLYFWKVTVAILILGIIAWMIVLTSRGSSGRASTWLHIGKVLAIGAGLVFVNFIVWGLFPNLWRSFWNNQPVFWAINLALWATVALGFIKRQYPLAGTGSKVLGTLAGLGIVFYLCAFWYGLAQKASASTVARAPSGSSLSAPGSELPIDVVLQPICECESGCQQFEPDGKTPLKNKGIPEKGVIPSDAFGKYQFRESHRAPAKALGYDLNTEEGQDSYARYRYQVNGTKDWEFDDQYGGGRVCWGPKLVALGTTREFEIVVPVPAASDKWSRVVEIPPGYSFTFKPKTTDRYLVKTDAGMVREYDPASPDCFSESGTVLDKNQCLLGAVKRLELQSKTDQPIEVVVKYFSYRPIN